jgi:hypothetical protein
MAGKLDGCFANQPRSYNLTSCGKTLNERDRKKFPRFSAILPVQDCQKILRFYPIKIGKKIKFSAILSVEDWQKILFFRNFIRLRLAKNQNFPRLNPLKIGKKSKKFRDFPHLYSFKIGNQQFFAILPVKDWQIPGGIFSVC